jgi:hypothetical protein
VHVITACPSKCLVVRSPRARFASRAAAVRFAMILRSILARLSVRSRKNSPLVPLRQCLRAGGRQDAAVLASDGGFDGHRCAYIAAAQTVARGTITVYPAASSELPPRAGPLTLNDACAARLLHRRLP